MKKFIALLLVALLLTPLCANAVSFTKTIEPDASDSAYVSLGTWYASPGKTGKICVYYTITTANVPNYTNHFRIYVDGATSANNNKWIAPDDNIAIESSAIKADSSVKVKARANTLYSSSITIKGTIGWPL